MTERFEQIATEYADGSQGGAYYGSSVRVLMRSPTHVMFTGYGVNLMRRENNCYNDTRKIASAAKRADLSTERAREAIVRVFGEGADEQAILAATTRGKGTILVDGGGKPLPLPRHVASKLHRADYESITPFADNLIPVTKTCLQCEKPLRPHLVSHQIFDSEPPENAPRTVEECQRFTNMPIFSVSGCSSNYPREWWPYIQRFDTWDGETYDQIDFCSDRCAAVYGRRAAAELAEKLPPNGEAPKPPRYQRETVQHFERKERNFTMKDGRIIAL